MGHVITLTKKEFRHRTNIKLLEDMDQEFPGLSEEMSVSERLLAYRRMIMIGEEFGQVVDINSIMSLNIDERVSN